MASTTWRARTVPVAVVRVTRSPALRSRCTRVASWIRPPAPSTASARPHASRAGLSIATPCRSSSPPRYVGEVTSSRVSSAVSSSASSPSSRIVWQRARRSASCQGSSATSSSPVRSKSQSIPRSRIVDSIASRLAAPKRCNSGISPGHRASPLPTPWVRLAAQNPPLRPVAAQPSRAPSSTTTWRPGCSSRASNAAHKPVNPAPTTARSTSRSPCSAARGSGRRLSSHHSGVEDACSRATSASRTDITGGLFPSPQAGSQAADLARRLLIS